MINLHEKLSEFSYGYGVTREVENLLSRAGCHVTPFLPSLVHEAELGFDVSFRILALFSCCSLSWVKNFSGFTARIPHKASHR